MSDMFVGDDGMLPSYIEFDHNNPGNLQKPIRECSPYIIILPLSIEMQALVDSASQDCKDRDQILDANLDKLMSRGAAMYKALYNPERAGKF